MDKIGTKRGLLALSPVVVLLVVYMVGSLILGDFYAIPIAVAFIVAAIYGLSLLRGKSMRERIDLFCRNGAALGTRISDDRFNMIRIIGKTFVVVKTIRDDFLLRGPVGDGGACCDLVNV